MKEGSRCRCTTADLGKAVATESACPRRRNQHGTAALAQGGQRLGQDSVDRKLGHPRLLGAGALSWKVLVLEQVPAPARNWGWFEPLVRRPSGLTLRRCFGSGAAPVQRFNLGLALFERGARSAA